jgi:hypothetical protein
MICPDYSPSSYGFVEHRASLEPPDGVEVFQIGMHREQTRGQLARGLVLILALTLTTVFMLVSFQLNTKIVTQAIF